MRWKLSALLFIGLLCLGGDLDAASTVTLIEAIAVQTPEVKLGEIAHISADSEKERQQLNQLVVEILPTVESSRMISAFKIKRLLEEKGFEEVRVVGLHSRAYVESRTMPLTEMEALIEQWVRQKIPSDVEFEMTYDHLPAQWKIPAGKEVQFEVHANYSRLGGLMNLTLRATGCCQTMATCQARIKLQLFRDSLVLSQPLLRGERVTSNHLAIERREITKASGMEMATADEALGLMAKRDLKSGLLLQKGDFDQPILVEKGSINRIVMVHGEVYMNIYGAKALQNGRKGEFVLFSNPINDKAPLHAQIVEQGLAMMQLS